MCATLCFWMLWHLNNIGMVVTMYVTQWTYMYFRFSTHKFSTMSGYTEVLKKLSNREKSYLLPNLSSKNNLPTFQLNAPVVIKAKVKEVQTNVAIYTHALLRIHVIGRQRSVRIAPPSLPPHHSGPATREFQSSISVEALLCRYHLQIIF